MISIAFSSNSSRRSAIPFIVGCGITINGIGSDFVSGRRTLPAGRSSQFYFLEIEIIVSVLHN
jgi:hypothetical protein